MEIKTYPWQAELLASLNELKDRLPNGILVYGPRGIGTFDAVHAFAKNLLCESPDLDGSACGHCHGCHMFDAHTHPDIRYVVSEAESVPRELPFTPPDNATDDRKNLYREILIYQTRALADFLNLTSHEGGKRVVIVYPADMIRAEAAASLLKNLEEPPEETVFLLVTDEIDRVLPTIRSRCRLIRARVPTKQESLAWLQSQGVADAERKLVEAGGMPLSVFDQDPRFYLAPDLRDKILDVLGQGKNANASDVIDSVGRDVTLSAAALLFSRWAWDLASVREGAEPRYYPERANALQKVAAEAPAAGLYMWINSVRDVRRVASHPLNAKTVIEALLLSYQRCLA
ncbi:MAG: DNA polymerase III subunit delta [Sutterellaceae bacterium]|nr:DNA polymerase III subunit delta [Sutterellaceae bacterium]